ncbi:hypothetical protein SAMN05421868_13433 [Paenibacillus naphthalenovorans]|nr:hypothetical protein SAMN05421868_13433 [Paenibacillus naphthalenovorans]
MIIMTLIEMLNKANEIALEHKDKYYYFGIRYEDLDREIGDECDWSKDNPEREDERDFPAYGTEEYDDLPTLDGTSAWSLDIDRSNYLPGYGNLRESDFDKDAERQFNTYHCYVVAGKKLGRHDCPDDGEILIKDAVVIGKLF